MRQPSQPGIVRRTDQTSPIPNTTYHPPAAGHKHAVEVHVLMLRHHENQTHIFEQDASSNKVPWVSLPEWAQVSLLKLRPSCSSGSAKRRPIIVYFTDGDPYPYVPDPCPPYKKQEHPEPDRASNEYKKTQKQCDATHPEIINSFTGSHRENI